MIAFAQKEMLLLLLLPYAVLLVWGLRKSGMRNQSILVLWLVTVIFVWGQLFVLYSLDIFYDPQMAFASVEYIMQDSYLHWILRFLSENFGWVPASIYFAICWGIARIIPGPEVRR